MIYLLDVNVLLAIAWPTHQFHNRTLSWFKKQQQSAAFGVATCPLTELSFLRVSMSTMDAEFSTAISLLQNFVSRKEFTSHFGSDDVTALTLHSIPIQGHNQLNDFYLAELAQRKNAKLATLDQRIVHPAVELIP